MGRFLANSLLAALSLSSTTTASSHIFARQQANCPANFSKCPQASLPDNFCCPSTSTCVTLAANTTVLCCPAGSDCTKIAPITCELEKQDPIKNPLSTLRTTALTSTLAKCGTKCCPFGYTCDKDNNCLLDKNQDIPPLAGPSSSIASSSTTPSTSSTTSIPTNSISPIITTTPTSAETSIPSSTALPIISESCPRFPTLSIIIFFFTGLAVGIFLTLATLFIIIKCSRNNKDTSTSHLRRASTASFGNKGSFQSSSNGTGTKAPSSKFISSPQLLPDSATRSDFLRKQEWDGTPSRRGGTIKTFLNRMSRGKTSPRPQQDLVVPELPAQNGQRGQTPVHIPSPLQIRKISSSTTSNTSKAGTARPQDPVTPPNQRAASSLDGFGHIVVFTDGQTADELRQQTSSSNYKEMGGSGLGIGNGNTMNGGGLLPPPMFKGEKDNLRGSGVTTFTQFMPGKDDGAANTANGTMGNGVIAGNNGGGKKGHRRTSSAIAGLVAHQPFNYNSPAGYSSPAHSDTGLRLQNM